MSEYAVHRAGLEIFKEIVLFQPPPIRFDNVSFSQVISAVHQKRIIFAGFKTAGFKPALRYFANSLDVL